MEVSRQKSVHSTTSVILIFLLSVNEFSYHSTKERNEIKGVTAPMHIIDFYFSAKSGISKRSVNFKEIRSVK